MGWICLPPLAALVDDLEGAGKGLVMFMGKGGVGKTTMAAAVATELAARGHDVLLTTTDPAAHIDESLVGGQPRLTVSRIDPAVETANYRESVMATKGKDLDDQARAMLAEDLRRAGVEPWAWIINSSLAAAETKQPLLRKPAHAEQEQIAKIRDGLARRYAVVPIQAQEPVGAKKLSGLCQNRSVTAAA